MLWNNGSYHVEIAQHERGGGGGGGGRPPYQRQVVSDEIHHEVTHEMTMMKLDKEDSQTRREPFHNCIHSYWIHM